MKKAIFLSILIFVLSSTFCHSNDQKVYLSPDGKYRAIIVHLPKAPYGSGESEIKIETNAGEILCSKSYGSEDGEHGYGVEKAAWSPNSKFFVFSMTSSGGHQAWNFPTYFVSTTDLNFNSLDDLIGPITDANFEFEAPDTIKMLGQDIKTLDEKSFKVSLSEITKNKNSR